MEDIRITLCASPPAKRAKLELKSSENNVGNESEGKIRHQRCLTHCLSNGDAVCGEDNSEKLSDLTEVQELSSLDFVVGDELRKVFNEDDGFGFVRNEGVSSSSDGIIDNDNNDLINSNRDINAVPDSSNESCINNDEDDDDFDEVASTISNLSGLSDLSDMSGLDWKPIAGPFLWVQRQMELGSNPRNLLQDLIPAGTLIPDHLDDVTLWKILCNILSEPPTRTKLSHINTLEDVVELLRVSKKIIVLTGAGVSVSSGIPDFRSRDGIYARLAKDFPDLPDPQAMFDIHYFRKDPRPFFKFAREIFPGQFEPSLSHKFIKLLENHGKLLRNYSQNIDTLEQIAGIQKVVQCHGSFATASCTKCGYKVTANHIKNGVFEQTIPKCPKCIDDVADDELAVMKPDIVFFGEGLPEEFHSTMAEDKDDCDLLIVIGSSLKVRPVALIPFSIPENVPQILINREPLKHVTFDVELLGDCDVIVNEICLRLDEGWNQITKFPKLTEKTQFPITSSPNPDETSPRKLTIRRISNGVCDSTSDNNNLASSSSDHVQVTSSEDAASDPDSTFKSLSPEQTYVPDDCYFFSPPNCYIFSGAEVSFFSSDNEESQSCGTGSGEDSGVGDLRPISDVRTAVSSREYF